MAKHLIVGYRIVWSNSSSPYGAVDIKYTRTQQYRFRSTDPAQLSFWVDMLRNEAPVYFDDDSEVMYTGTEPIGSGD